VRTNNVYRLVAFFFSEEGIELCRQGNYVCDRPSLFWQKIMNAPLNQEVVNDTAKLIMHRLIARSLGRDPLLIDRAKLSLAKMSARFPNSIQTKFLSSAVRVSSCRGPMRRLQ
jgi:hypothetical protein